MQREVQQAAYEYQRAVEAGDQTVVGVNRYIVEGASSLPLLRIDPEIERAQVERLQKLRRRRDGARVTAALKQVEATARSEPNLMPAILNAANAHATVGEISDAMRRAFGEYQESVAI